MGLVELCLMIFVGNEIVARSWYHLQVLSLLNEFLIVIHLIVFYRFFNFMLHVESMNCTQTSHKRCKSSFVHHKIKDSHFLFYI